MDCTTVQTILAGEREDDLDDAGARSLGEHLGSCSGCQDRLGQAEDEVQTLANQFEPPEPSPEAWERVTQAVATAAREAPVSVRKGGGGGRIMPVFFAAAAALLLAAGATFMQAWNGGHTTPDSTGAIVMPGTLSHTDDAEVTRLQAGPGYEAGSTVEGELVCLWVRPR